MKKKHPFLILILLLSICSCSKPEPFMDYVFSWGEDSTVLEIELSYAAREKDSTTFIFGDPGHGGQLDIFNVIKNIRVSEPETLKINETDRHITVYHNGAKKHKIFYEIHGSFSADKPTTISQTELFRPVIANGIATLIDTQFALRVTDKSNPLVSIQWRNYPKKFTYFNSVEPSQSDPSKKVTDTYNNISKRILLVMGNNINVKKYNVMGIPYYSVTTIEDRYGNDLQERLSPFFESYFPSIHRFWDDTNFPFYFLAVTALQNNQKEIGGGGFGINNGFVMKLGTKFDIWEKYVTAHETAHTWVGLKMMLGEDSFDHQWFGEGFNDYTTIINLANSKIYGNEEFLEYLNEKNFKQHYESEVKGAHNDSIAAKYWTDYANYGKLPYRRGCIYAFYLDNQIRLASDGTFTLRNLLLDLYALKKAKKSDEILTVEDFIDMGATYIHRDKLVEQVYHYMIEGQPIDFSNVKLIDAFHIEFNDSIPKLSLTESADLSAIYQW